MERMNGEVRDREKVMRGLKIVDTKILPGYQVYHNYIGPHMVLDGKTPAEICGIKIEGENKWKTLIENAFYDLLRLYRGSIHICWYSEETRTTYTTGNSFCSARLARLRS